eukprot:scaffold347437_cov35-Attheya_sp.AAC.1
MPPGMIASLEARREALPPPNARAATCSVWYMVAISQNSAALGSAHPNTRHASVIHTVYCTTV